MPKIVLIDDDLATEILAEGLGFYGYEANRISSYQLAIDSLETILTADLVILDIIMERPKSEERSSVSGDRTTGMSLLRAIREKNDKIPVIVLSATSDRDVIDAVRQTPNTIFISKWNIPRLVELVRMIQQAIGGPSKNLKPRAFIVHGHDATEKLALKNYLQNTLGFAEPIILHEQPNVGRTIIEKLEDYAMVTDVAFVLLTPDDKIFSGKGSDDEKRRARQNVILELGLFIGIFGRKSGRVLLLYKGPLDLPSDLSGVIYIDISKGIDSAGEEIRRELANVTGA